jgi:hypothetical protein
LRLLHGAKETGFRMDDDDPHEMDRMAGCGVV